MAEKIVIVGGGIAAVNAIKAIREIDNKSEIHLFGNEWYYPYHRIRLTKGLFESMMEEKIRIQKIDWYEANNVSVYLGTEVIGVNIAESKIILKDNISFDYTKLLLASGARNFIPPINGINKDGVYSIRQLEDVHNIQKDLEEKDTILNIGGGIQGLETAWILNQQGKKVIVAEVQERLMPRQLDEKASDILKKAIESFNIDVLLNTQISEILGESKVSGATTKSGNTLKCDMVIVSVGIRPNVELVKGSDIEVSKGIVVNDKMETNLKNIYAAGDIAEVNGKIGGTWPSAVEQGKTAGYNIAGKETKYTEAIQATTLNAFNISLFSIGNVDAKQCTETLTYDDTDENSYKRLFIKDGKVVGAILMGDTKKSMALKSIIERKADFSSVAYASMSFNDFIDSLKNN
ncbi:NAD(P)/FAD-dependent oxidoreductase [Clostridium fungisolvens]|uniref:Nitrite reductase [NAD(P)H] n=1 Tax=Clostridium fungisolvens TaxID=1604897 RepID=A0A6V8SMM7_9CLOT|nr:FAD-dependent oxidoreductase [Clostridium fungisolvens]GFP76428.1 Nitrite reductase [NAD(P)H] [Clostridium fungisolvens]